MEHLLRREARLRLGLRRSIIRAEKRKIGSVK
jgi:hypothetical protein